MTAASGRAPWRVLVVDDEENLNWSLVNSLRKEGYTTDSALSGEEALRRLEAAPYDCVISDVKMPGMDGFELLQWLRQRRPETRVIMMTAFGSPTARQDAVRAGVIAYLEKPFDLGALKAELRRLFGADGAGAAAESEGYDLLEVARVLNLARRDIALAVQCGGHSGTLRFMRGELVWAEAGALQGEAAFLALCAPRGGRAQPEPWDGRSERNVTRPVSHLIYQALSARDARVAAITTSGEAQAMSAPPSAAASDPPTSDTSDATGVPAADVADFTDGIVTLDAADAAHEPPSATVDAEVASPQPIPHAMQGALAILATPTTPATPATGFAEPVEALARALGTPCGVVLQRIDGTVLAQCWQGLQPLPAGTYVHLAAAALAAARALLLADLGSLDGASIHCGEFALLLCRVAHGDRAALLVALLPADAGSAAAVATLRTYADTLDPVLR